MTTSNIENAASRQVQAPAAEETEPKAPAQAAQKPAADRPYSPGLEGVIAAETASDMSMARTAGSSTVATRSVSSSRRARTVAWPSCCGPASGASLRAWFRSRSRSR